MFPKVQPPFVIIKKLKFNNFSPGGVVEWFKALVLKTSVSARVPWVRIPPPPFYLKATLNLTN